MFNVYGPPRDFLEKRLEPVQSAIAQYLGKPREQWLQIAFEVGGEEGGIDLIYLSAWRKHLKAPCFGLFKREDFAIDDVTDEKVIAGYDSLVDVNERRKGRVMQEVFYGPFNSFRTVIACKYRGIKIAFFGVDHIGGPSATNWTGQRYAFIRKDDAQKFIEALKDLCLKTTGTYSIYTYDVDSTGDVDSDVSSGSPQSWDNLVLNESVLNLVRKDAESFIARKEWFIKNHLPFRRGYLFHGPPGNGKTSVIKTLLSTLNMNGYKIRLFSKNINDKALEKMFQDAQSNGPNIVVLEDLDRAFPKTGEGDRSHIGMHTLLNCLDGLNSQEGVITIATANEPTILDRAILKRPGRFDRVVFFDNPDHHTRLLYFQKKAPYLDVQQIIQAVDDTEGFSFAQLQETYILAGQRAYERNEVEIVGDDLRDGAAMLKSATNSIILDKTNKKGF